MYFHNIPSSSSGRDDTCISPVDTSMYAMPTMRAESAVEDDDGDEDDDDDDDDDEMELSSLVARVGATGNADTAIK
jgi:hypothetical protein